MGQLVSIKGSREKREIEDSELIIRGIEDLLCRARDGKLRAVCYAAVEETGDMALGGLTKPHSHAHELVGLATVLQEALLRTLQSGK